MMNEAPSDDLQAWVKAWQTAGPVLEQMRRESIRAASMSEAIAALDDAFEAALENHQPQQTSGLVIQQQIFARLRPCENS